jgi:hypothetical protein
MILVPLLGSALIAGGPILSRLPDAIPNAGFEAEGSLLSGWDVELARGYDAVADTEQPYRGRRSALIAYRARSGPDPSPITSLSTRISALQYRGRTVRVSAAVRLPAAGSGRLVVWANGAGGPREESVSFAGSEWQRVGAEIAVPDQSGIIRIAFEITPGNDLAVDDVTIEAVGD